MDTQDFQIKQKEVIAAIEKQVQAQSIQFSTISPTDNFEDDTRMCLTSVHFPRQNLIREIQKHILSPLVQHCPGAYFYDDSSLHMTIKNIRVIHDPPNFTGETIQTAKKVFSECVPKHPSFCVNFYRLFFFPNNLALLGTSEPAQDELIADLDKRLIQSGIPDDKTYINTKYFFINVTLARFQQPPSAEFVHMVEGISNTIACDPYRIDTVSLVSSNAAMKRRTTFGTWKLQKS